MNDIQDLRSHLFDTLRALKDKENPMDLDRAKAIADVGKVIVDSARVEVAFCKATGERAGTKFLPLAVDDLTRPADAPAATNGLAPLRPARRQ